MVVNTPTQHNKLAVIASTRAADSHRYIARFDSTAGLLLPPSSLRGTIAKCRACSYAHSYPQILPHRTSFSYAATHTSRTYLIRPLPLTSWWNATGSVDTGTHRPAALGRTATHAIVHARLIVSGQDHGVKPFFVQLRDLDTHHNLSGIESGSASQLLPAES